MGRVFAALMVGMFITTIILAVGVFIGTGRSVINKPICHSNGYPSLVMAHPFSKAYCLKRENQTDVMIPVNLLEK